MIPKKIHYCWFGKKEKPELVKRCISSWKKFMQDYEIVEWNEDNFDFDYHPYLRWCYENKKWAYLSDFARLLVVEQYGGIYFDTDIEAIARFFSSDIHYFLLCLVYIIFCAILVLYIGMTTTYLLTSDNLHTDFTFLPGFPSLGLIFVGGLVLFELNQKSPGRTAFQRILHRTTKLNHGNHLICSYSHLYYKFKSNLAPHSGVVHKYHLMEKVGSKPSFFSIKRFSADLIASSRISFKSSSEMPFRTSSSPN